MVGRLRFPLETSSSLTAATRSVRSTTTREPPVAMPTHSRPADGRRMWWGPETSMPTACGCPEVVSIRPWSTQTSRCTGEERYEFTIWRRIHDGAAVLWVDHRVERGLCVDGGRVWRRSAHRSWD